MYFVHFIHLFNNINVKFETANLDFKLKQHKIRYLKKLVPKSEYDKLI